MVHFKSTSTSLFNLYVHAVEWVTHHGFKIHMHGDDIQCNFYYSSDTEMTVTVDKIESFISDLNWQMKIFVGQ